MYDITLKFLDLNKSCRKLVQTSLNTDPNSRYNVISIKDEKTIDPTKWKISKINDTSFLVEIERISRGTFKFSGDKDDVDYLVGLIKFNFGSTMEYMDEEEKNEEKIENVKEESGKVFEKLYKERSKKVILAVEEGSSAWGLSSVESDHDIRFIYLSDIEYYLSIEQGQRDCVMFEEKNMDFSGWDIRKALQLCRESNPGLLDWLRTSKVLVKEEKIISELLEISIGNYCPKALCYHWLNTAEKHDRLFFGEKKEVILKKYFYVLRPLLCIEWLRLSLIDNKSKELPPMYLIDLLNSIPCEKESCNINIELKKEISILIDKKTKYNLGIGPRIPILDDFISKSWQFYGNFCKNLQKRQLDQQEMRKFDSFFRKIIKEYVLIDYKSEIK
eukprot:TRINITY_DN5013_c0_g1_i1.p1 TRINITY_DN5013_c0_g1~~TRINITY_DN5013_c0_g1_i1.p1  ORF type:complete len:388 (-),score=118.57 TRINITY_DN5013_c0_g1_i1:24-1187(-)